jgi:hypothetical protein
MAEAQDRADEIVHQRQVMLRQNELLEQQRRIRNEIEGLQARAGAFSEELQALLADERARLDIASQERVVLAEARQAD